MKKFTLLAVLLLVAANAINAGATDKGKKALSKEEKAAKKEQVKAKNKKGNNKDSLEKTIRKHKRAMNQAS